MAWLRAEYGSAASFFFLTDSFFPNLFLFKSFGTEIEEDNNFCNGSLLSHLFSLGSTATGQSEMPTLRFQPLWGRVSGVMGQASGHPCRLFQVPYAFWNPWFGFATLCYEPVMKGS